MEKRKPRKQGVEMNRSLDEADAWWSEYDEVTLLWEEGRLYESRQRLDAAEKRFGVSGATRLAQGLQRLHEAGEVPAAERWKLIRPLVEASVSDAEQDARTLVLAVVVLCDVGEFEAAKRYIELVVPKEEELKAHPFHVAAYFVAVALAFEDADDLERAEELIRIAIEIVPDDGSYFARLAAVLESQGRVDEARDARARSAALRTERRPVPWRLTTTLGTTSTSTAPWEYRLAVGTQ
jgi:tetratricopeptide (TPR) repeat protein